MNSTPPRRTLGTSSIVTRAKEAFLLWSSISPHMPKTVRYTTGSRIENHFLDLLETIYQAYYAQAEKKSDLLTTAIHKNDLLTFLVQISWENKFIKQSQYATLSDKLYEIGKMLGGWKNNNDTKTKQHTP